MAKKVVKPVKKAAAPKKKSSSAKPAAKSAGKAAPKKKKAPKAKEEESVPEVVLDEALIEEYDAAADAVFVETFGKELPYLERELEDGRLLISELFWVHAYVKE